MFTVHYLLKTEELGMNIQMPDRSTDGQMDRRLTDGGYKKDG